jgi:hypothetical protein
MCLACLIVVLTIPVCDEVRRHERGVLEACGDRSRRNGSTSSTECRYAGTCPLAADADSRTRDIDTEFHQIRIKNFRTR